MVITAGDALALSEKVLAAWNRQDVEGVVACYTEDCVYLDPNTHGPVEGRDALRRYLTKLFGRWKMHWTLKEFHTFGEVSGGGFLWSATLTPTDGGRTVEVEGMDLVMLRENLLRRNEVYFDRMALFGGAD
ncbi:MAG TPA: nuclear transport factor 2 family protein [Dehalococcoidia bacterium]